MSQLSTFPLGSSAGGFSFTFDPSLGTYTRTTTSFGPSFAERAVTIGRGQFSIGANYQHATYRSFEGKRLQGGDIKFYLTHLQETSAFLSRATLLKRPCRWAEDRHICFLCQLRPRRPPGCGHRRADRSGEPRRHGRRQNPAARDAGHGPHGRHSHVSRRRVDGHLQRLWIGERYRGRPAQGQVPLPQACRRRAGGRRRCAHPDGRRAQPSGTGTPQAKFLLIGSTAAGNVSPHFNIGYTVSGTSSTTLTNDEVNYAGGVEFTPSARVTIIADLIGRQLRGSGRLVEQSRAFNWTTQTGCTRIVDVFRVRIGTGELEPEQCLAWREVQSDAEPSGVGKHPLSPHRPRSTESPRPGHRSRLLVLARGSTPLEDHHGRRFSEGETRKRWRLTVQRQRVV